MRKQAFFYAGIALTLSLAQNACAYRVPPIGSPIIIGGEKRTEDVEIARTIEEKILEDQQTAPYFDRVRIDVDQGVVTIWGHINSHRARLLIEKKARGVSRVREVRMDIEVDPTNTDYSLYGIDRAPRLN